MNGGYIMLSTKRPDFFVPVFVHWYSGKTYVPQAWDKSGPARYNGYGARYTLAQGMEGHKPNSIVRVYLK